MQAFPLVLVLCFFHVCAKASDTAGFKTIMSYNGVEKVKDILVPIIQSQVVGLQIPEISGTDQTPIGIKVNYDITDMVVTQFAFGATSVYFAPGIGVNLLIETASATVNLNWAYSSNLGISGSGTATASVTIVIFSQIALAATPAGEPAIYINGLDLGLGDLNISVHGGVSWLYQWLVDLFDGTISNILQSAIQNELYSIINSAAQSYLGSTPVQYPLTPDLKVDYSLIANPYVDTTYSATYHKGVFVWDIGTTCTNPVLNLPDIVPLLPTAFVISPQMLDCLMDVLYEENLMQYAILPQDVPPKSPIQLNTSNSNLQHLVPELYAMWPNCAIQLAVSAQTPPIGSIQQNCEGSACLQMLLDGLVNVSVIDHNGQPQHAFTFQLTLAPNVYVSIVSQSLVGKIGAVSQRTAILDSSIGNISQTNLDTLVNFFVSWGVVPTLNQLGAKGIPLPQTAGVQLVNTTLSYGDTYFLVETDFTYNAELLAREITEKTKERRTNSLM